MSKIAILSDSYSTNICSEKVHNNEILAKIFFKSQCLELYVVNKITFLKLVRFNNIEPIPVIKMLDGNVLPRSPKGCIHM